MKKWKVSTFYNLEVLKIWCLWWKYWKIESKSLVSLGSGCMEWMCWTSKKFSKPWGHHSESDVFQWKENLFLADGFEQLDLSNQTRWTVQLKWKSMRKDNPRRKKEEFLSFTEWKWKYNRITWKIQTWNKEARKFQEFNELIRELKE